MLRVVYLYLLRFFSISFLIAISELSVEKKKERKTFETLSPSIIYFTDNVVSKRGRKMKGMKRKGAKMGLAANKSEGKEDGKLLREKLYHSELKN